MKRDVFGQELAAGDQVLFLLQTGSQRSSKSLERGTVTRVSENWVEIRYTHPQYPQLGESLAKRWDNIVKVPEEFRNV